MTSIFLKAPFSTQKLFSLQNPFRTSLIFKSPIFDPNAFSTSKFLQNINFPSSPVFNQCASFQPQNSFRTSIFHRTHIFYPKSPSVKSVHKFWSGFSDARVLSFSKVFQSPLFPHSIFLLALFIPTFR